MTKVIEYSKKIPFELKMVFKDAPQDDIDWALVMYLFRHSNCDYIDNGLLFEEKNVITVGKIAAYFNLEYNDVYKRLRRMIWWVSVGTVYGYRKPFSVCNITIMGVNTIIKIIETFTINKEL